ncbi:MAG: FAD-dependent oxidoreductase, partial [Gemmatimonadales bacterium]
QKIVEMGGVVSLEHRSVRFNRDGNSICSVDVATPNGMERLEAEQFISTIPLATLAQNLGEETPASVLAAAEGLTYRDFVLVALILDRDNLFPDNWIYVHTRGVKVGRIQNFNNWSADMVPVEGVTCLGMEYFAFEGDGLWTTDDAALIELASNELQKLKLASGATVIDGTVVRMPKAYPIYDAAYAEHVSTIRRHLDSIHNLQTVGRNGMHKYNNQDHSMYTAMLAVENMLGRDHDIWSVNTDLEYHEEQRIDERTSASSMTKVAQ